MTKPRPIVILGPTAGGKSELAVELAEQLGGEVIGADSMQVYRHLDAGTAKPPAALRRRVRHHLIDIIASIDPFTVADWLERAEALIEALGRGNTAPVIVGGTNLYLKALLEGMFEGPPADALFRAALAEMTPGELHDQLRQCDPEAAQRIHPNDRKRIVRALEVFELTGTPISQWQQQWVSEKENTTPATRNLQPATPTYRHNPILIGLTWPTEIINQRINQRVKAMFFPQQVDAALAAAIVPNGESLPDETRRLESAGMLGAQAREALGYKQVLDHLAGRCSLDEAFEQTKIQTRRFAKHQRTWMRRFRGVNWLDGPVDLRNLAELAIDAARSAVIR